MAESNKLIKTLQDICKQRGYTLIALDDCECIDNFYIIINQSDKILMIRKSISAQDLTDITKKLSRVI